MSEAGRHHMYGHASPQERGGVGMTQIMKPGSR